MEFIIFVIVFKTYSYEINRRISGYPTILYEETC